jgi:hypothetical protein
VMVGVTLSLIRRGPAAAEEAWARGDTLVTWWTATNSREGSARAGMHRRLALRGSPDRALGTVVSEESAAQPSFGR